MTFDPSKLQLFGRDTIMPSPFPTYAAPRALTLEEARYLVDRDEIMTLEVEGTVRGYPIRVVAPHHVVEDTLHGKPVVVTF